MKSLLDKIMIALVIILSAALAFTMLTGFGEGPYMPIAGLPRDAPCKTVTVNANGVGNADIVVDATATGKTVLAPLTTRCGAIIYNSGSDSMRCGPSTITVTSTVGQFVPAGGALVLGGEGQQGWKCIRVTTDTAASVSESRP